MEPVLAVVLVDAVLLSACSALGPDRAERFAAARPCARESASAADAVGLGGILRCATDAEVDGGPDAEERAPRLRW